MSLNIKDAKAPGQKSNRPLPKPGTQPARIVHVVDLGVQKRSFQGKPKDPVRQIFINFELVNEEHKDGEVTYRLNLSPRRFAFVNHEKSALVDFMTKIDPEDKLGGDLSKLVDLPALVTVAHSKIVREGQEKTVANFNGVMPPMEGMTIKPLFGTPVYFEFDDPKIEAARELPKFLRDIIKEAVNYEGSPAQKVIAQIDAEWEAKSKENASTEAKAEVDSSQAPY